MNFKARAPTDPNLASRGAEPGRAPEADRRGADENQEHRHKGRERVSPLQGTRSPGLPPDTTEMLLEEGGRETGTLGRPFFLKGSPFLTSLTNSPILQTGRLRVREGGGVTYPRSLAAGASCLPTAEADTLPLPIREAAFTANWLPTMHG